MRVLTITSEWPTPENPVLAPFVVRQVEFLRRAGLEVDVFPFRGAKSPARYWRYWRQARAKLQQTHYDVIHAQFGQSGVLALPKTAPLVVTMRGSDVHGIISNVSGQYTTAGRVLQQVSRVVAQQADEVIVVSRHMIDLLPKREYHVIPSGFDLDLFHPIPIAEARAQLDLPLDQPLIFFGANPAVKRKRFGLAEAAIEVARQEFPDIRLIPARQIPHAQIPIYMNACDALIMVSTHEGSPDVVKEALACDLPVVSVDTGDVWERIGAIDGCVRCADDRPETIGAGLVDVLRARRRIDGSAIRETFDETRLTEQVLAVYQQAQQRFHRGTTHGSTAKDAS
ncbi:MAG: glycosyltransferase family 4 protein [Chloroflexi bacterium]|nr:glycosyltransferase family 4 protein [Chloroflexota bacterium]